MSRSPPPSTGPAATAAAHRRVLVLLESGSAGAATVDLARELAKNDHATITIVGEVPKARSGSRCGNSASEYNSAVRDTVANELAQARRRLGAVAARTTFELLIEGTDPPLHDWAATAGFDVVLLPSRRRPLRSVKHPAAARLRSRTGADVHIGAGRARAKQRITVLPSVDAVASGPRARRRPRHAVGAGRSEGRPRWRLPGKERRRTTE